MKGCALDRQSHDIAWNKERNRMTLKRDRRLHATIRSEARGRWWVWQCWLCTDSDRADDAAAAWGDFLDHEHKAHR